MLLNKLVSFFNYFLSIKHLFLSSSHLPIPTKDKDQKEERGKGTERKEKGRREGERELKKEKKKQRNPVSHKHNKRKRNFYVVHIQKFISHSVHQSITLCHELGNILLYQSSGIMVKYLIDRVLQSFKNVYFYIIDVIV